MFTLDLSIPDTSSFRVNNPALKSSNVKHTSSKDQTTYRGTILYNSEQSETSVKAKFIIHNSCRVDWPNVNKTERTLRH